MTIGYARVSTIDQTLALQQDALTKAGCQEIFTDTASGSRTDRPGLAEAMHYVRSGDTLIVWRLDRLGRSLRDLIDLVGRLGEQGVQFVSLQEHIDTTTSAGTLVFQMFAMLAEFERNLIRERTMAGLSAARARGRRGGQRPLSPEKVRQLRTLAAAKANKVADICKTLGISRATFYRYLPGEHGELA